MNKDELIANQYVYIKNLQKECERHEKRIKELEALTENVQV